MLIFIGGGNMASSLLGGWLAQNNPPSSVCVVETDPQRAAGLRLHWPVRIEADANQVLPSATTVVLAVKPQQVSAALQNLQWAEDTLLVSIAAGVTVDSLRALVPSHVEVVRSMPNTPALVRQGISGLYASDAVSDRARMRAEAVLGAVGRTCWVPEETQLDSVTAVSGSGPAYVFLLTEVMSEIGQQLGLEAVVAQQLAKQTVIGAARMLEHSGEPPDALRRQVTSPAGTTQAAIECLQNGGFEPLFAQALQAAKLRSAELGDELAASIAAGKNKESHGRQS